jgi:mannose-6-phosphate isomerase-like protein (cupin superfamily)
MSGDQNSNRPGGLLAGIGISHMSVYEDRPAPDGLNSGCGHVHAITDEAYFCVAGEGYLELHDLDHGYRPVPLSPGAFVQFSPGTLHRVVSTGGLQVVVIMGNAGLAERGDARIYFGAEVDGDPDRYAELAALPKVKGRPGALERRDASVSAYMNLMALKDSDHEAYLAELKRFVDCHFAAAAEKRETFEAVVQAGPVAWAETALARVRSLPDHPLAPQTVGQPAAPDGEPILGMCGLLRPVETLTETVPGLMPNPAG